MSLGLFPLSESQVVLGSNEDADATRAVTGGGVTERFHLSPGHGYSPSQGSIEIASLERKTNSRSQAHQAEMVHRHIQMELQQRSSCSLGSFSLVKEL